MDIPIELIQEMEKYAKERGVKLFTSFDVIDYKFKVLFEKFNFSTRINLDPVDIMSSESPIEYLKFWVDQACDLLQECKF